MSRFIVFEPAGTGPSEGTRFVRDAFAGWALLFPFVWLFRHGLWLSGLAVLVLWLGLGWLADRPGFEAAGLLPLLLGLLVAFEGPMLRAARLGRKGFREVAVVQAKSEDEAAILYYTGAESNLVSRESGADSRETPPQGFYGRPGGTSQTLFDPPRTLT